MRGGMNAVAIVETMERYHRTAYPEDFPWDHWQIEHGFAMDRDEEVMTLRYRNPADMHSSGVYARFVMGGMVKGMPEALHGGDALIQRLMEEFDRMRMEIIEMLDGLQQAKLQPKLRLVKGIE